MYKIFVINPGSTSTKVAFFHDEVEQFSENIHHPNDDLAGFDKISDEFDFRFSVLKYFLETNNIPIDTIDAFVGRGGLIRPIPSGTYLVDETMCSDLESGQFGDHASNLGGLLAHSLAKISNKPAFIVDPVVVDEMDDISRLSGHPELPRKSIFHALNHKAVARKVAEQLGKKYENLNLIIAHLGGGISIGAHKQGRVVDVNNALDGEGPFSPERSGTLPTGDLMRLCFSGTYDKTHIAKMIKGKGGLCAYLGTNDARKVEENIAQGDETAKLVYDAMAFQISKFISCMAVNFNGDVDAVVMTGGIAHDKNLMNTIKSRVSFLGPFLVFPGEKELEALALGALRVLSGKEKAKNYADEVIV